MRKVLLISLLVFFNSSLRAQDVNNQTIRWHVANTQEIKTGKFSDDPDQIVCYGTTRIEWRNVAGVVKRTFTISETNGTWTNVQNHGSILYEVNEGERLGTVRIFRTASELTVRITLLKEEGDPDLYEFSIANLETL